MKIDELRQLTSEELAQKRLDLSSELINLRHQRVISPIENPMRIREVRRTLAQVETLFRERELGIR
ncbi:MAG: 50S ribosomal protein L29 [bacterium]